MSVAQNLGKILSKLLNTSCKLVAVTKTHPVEVLMEAYEAGYKCYGENKVQVSVLNNNGVESLRETVYATSDVTTAGDLYIISIGVSNYKDTKFNLSYAAKDAEDMVNAFEGNTVYETVHQKIMINDQVTRENIFELKEYLSQ